MGKRISIVDDDYGSAQLLQMLLEMEGFETRIFVDGNDALTEATDRVDAFIIDLHLSGEYNGLDILEAIRSGRTAASAETPVIMISGDLRKETDAITAGANIFMLKPFSPRKLSLQIKNLTT